MANGVYNQCYPIKVTTTQPPDLSVNVTEQGNHCIKYVGINSSVFTQRLDCDGDLTLLIALWRISNEEKETRGEIQH